MCTNPKKIYRQGYYVEDTYKGKKGEEYFIETFSKCGYCQQCINEKSNNWVIRNTYEAKGHTKKCFITLTYKDNPIFLIKKHFQDFMKRLRRHLDYRNKDKVRMFLAGEYGTLHGRPHGHIIIYGWEEDKENLEYIGINKKGNILLSSKTINKLWKFGRTTYQIFDEHEIPYIALYETAKEETAHYYLQKKEKVKELIKELSKKECTLVHRKLMLLTLKKELRKQENNKSEYLSIKEFNLWSKAVGWEQFEKQYRKINNYDWHEYIEDKDYMTPTSWIKKLANKGDKSAINEMIRRANEYSITETEEELKAKNRIREAERTIKNKLDWVTKKDKLEL